MSFTESNTVEQMILDAATTLGNGAGSSVLREDPPSGWGGSLGEEFKPSRWTYVAATQIPRQLGEVMVERWLREALIALNPEIAAQPDRADEVIYALRAILLAVVADGLVRANENFTNWLRGEKTMPFGPNGEHVPVRLLDWVHPDRNRLTVTNQWVFQKGHGGEALRRGLSHQRPAAGDRRGEDADAQRGDVVRRRVPDQSNLRVRSAGDVSPQCVFVCDRRKAVPLWFDPHADRSVGAVASG